MEYEYHFDTRQDYIKQGNELAALEEKQEREKKEQEKAMKEMQAANAAITAQANNVASSSGEPMPAFVPQKQTSNPEPTPMNQAPQGPIPNLNDMASLRGVENRGRMGFQNSMPSSMQMPMGQNRNPFQGGNF